MAAHCNIVAQLFDKDQPLVPLRSDAEKSQSVFWVHFIRFISTFTLILLDCTGSAKMGGWELNINNNSKESFCTDGRSWVLVGGLIQVQRSSNGTSASLTWVRSSAAHR